MRPVIDQQLYHPETEKVITYNLTNIPCKSFQNNLLHLRAFYIHWFLLYILAGSKESLYANMCIAPLILMPAIFTQYFKYYGCSWKLMAKR